jgi:hypothetical protein
MPTFDGLLIVVAVAFVEPDPERGPLMAMSGRRRYGGPSEGSRQ